MSLTLSIPAVAVGLLIGYFLRKFLAGRKAAQAETRAEAILNESKAKAQDVLLDANNKALKVLEDSKREEADRRKQLDRIENLMTKKESDLEERGKEVAGERASLKHKAEELVALKADTEQAHAKQVAELERVSGLNREQARDQIMAKVAEQYRDDLYHQLRKLDSENRYQFEQKAR